jgi:TonB family protein
MTTFIIQWSIYVALLYLVYKLLLSKLTFFAGNRVFLLFGLLLGFVLALPKSVEVLPQTTIRLNIIEVSATVGETITAAPSFNLWKAIYFTGMGLAFLYLVYKLIGVYRTVGAKNENIPSFSFFTYIYINPTQSNREMVLEHEQIHVSKLHSIDVVLLEILKILQWFNPAVYLLAKEVKVLHEYEVDAELHKKYGNQYGEVLLATALNTDHLHITNSFGIKSLTKNRIKMMTQNRTTKMQVLRYALALPLLLLAYCSKAPHTIIPQQEEKIYRDAEDFAELDKDAEFEGGYEMVYEYLSKTVTYPEIARENAVQGKVFVSFVVSSDGSIRDVKVMNKKKEDSSPYEQYLWDEAVRVIQAMPNWTPAEKDGKTVSVEQVIPINFMIKEDIKE